MKKLFLKTISLIYSVNLIYEIKNKRYWGSDIRMTTRPCFVRPNYVRACEPKIFSQEFAVCGDQLTLGARLNWTCWIICNEGVT